MDSYCGATRDLDAYLANRDDEDAYDDLTDYIETERKAEFREEAERQFNINSPDGILWGLYWLNEERQHAGKVQALIAANNCEGLMALVKQCVQEACEHHIKEYVDDKFGAKPIEAWVSEHEDSIAANIWDGSE